jgi:replication-associated recombination protein RarA
MLCFGPPGVGKTNMVLNSIVRANPPFRKIYVLHCDENSLDYDGLETEFLPDIPEPYDSDKFGRVKTLLIIDDREFRFMSKQQLRRLDRLYGYTSTHKNLSIACNAQDMFNLPPCIRRMSNIHVMWKVLDLDLHKIIGRRIGLTKENLDYLFEKLKTMHDCLVVDMTPGTPARLRINGYEVVRLDAKVSSTVDIPTELEPLSDSEQKDEMDEDDSEDSDPDNPTN